MRRHSEWNADPPRAGASPEKTRQGGRCYSIFNKYSFFLKKKLRVCITLLKCRSMRLSGPIDFLSADSNLQPVLQIRAPLRH